MSMMGDLETGRPITYIGRVIPVVHRSEDGQDGRVHIEFYGKPEANPLVRMSWTDAKGIAHKQERNVPALTDLVSGQVHVYFNSPLSIAYIRAGKLRALAVTTSTRWEGLPDLPTVSEFLPGYEASAWFGIGAPRNTPTEIIGKLNKEINAGLADPKIKARIADLGATVLPGSPADFGKLIADETEKWGKVIRAANIKPM